MSSLLTVRRALCALVACCLVALGAAGCGSGGSGNADADPAAVTPAGGVLYLEATIRPQGDQRARLDSLLGRIAHTSDVGAQIRGAIDRAGRARGITYEKDINPWLGNRAAVYVSSFRPGALGSSPTADIAVIIAARDTGKASDELPRLVPGARKQTYRDATYYLSGNHAAGVVGDYVVVGTPTAFRRVVDVSAGAAPKLSDASDYSRTTGLLASGTLGRMYLKIGPLLQSAIAARGGSAAALGPFLGQLQSTSSAAALRALANGFQLEVATVGAHTPAGPTGDAPGALRAVPGDAWLGVGIGAVGARARQTLAQLSQGQGVNGVPLDSVLRQLRAQTGIDVPHDVLSWMGDGALFVRGTSKSTLDGALVVHSTDPALTRSTLAKLGRYLRRSVHGSTTVGALSGVAGAQGLAIRTKGTEIDLAIGGSKFVIAYRRSALEAALGSSSGTLGSTPRFQSAASTLGGLPPTLFLDMRAVTRLIAAGSTSPSTQRALPYLRAFTSVIAGGRREGNVSRARVVVGVG